jgi:hypothetical protein
VLLYKHASEGVFKLKENKDIVEYNKGEIILGNDTEEKKCKHHIEVPLEIIDAISKAFQNQTNFKQEIQSTGDVVQNLWEVILTPEFQVGVDNGDFIIKRSLEIRNSKTGKFVGKAQLKEAELNKANIDKINQASPLSKLSRSICNLSGQMQVAEISKKLDVIDEKIDLISEFLWRDKVSDLYGIKAVIEVALDSLPNQRAIDRINNVLSEFFESTIESILNRKIQYNLGVDFFEGLKIWEIAKKNRTEYNSQYIKKAKEFINEYGFLMELYFRTLGLIGTCYQIVDEYHNAKKYYDRINDKINFYSLELVNKLVYIYKFSLKRDCVLGNCFHSSWRILYSTIRTVIAFV